MCVTNYELSSNNHSHLEQPMRLHALLAMLGRLHHKIQLRGSPFEDSGNLLTDSSICHHAFDFLIKYVLSACPDQGVARR